MTDAAHDAGRRANTVVLNISGRTHSGEADTFDCRPHWGLNTRAKNEKLMYSECVRASCRPTDFSFIFHLRMFLPNTVSEMRKIIRAGKLQLLGLQYWRNKWSG